MSLACTPGKLKSHHQYEDQKIKEVLRRNGINVASDLYSPDKIGVLTEEIIQKLFVQSILDQAIRGNSRVTPARRNRKEPDFLIEENGKAVITVEVYAPAFTEKLVKKSKTLKAGEFLESTSTLYPLETKTIEDKLNKYASEYPFSKQCLFLFILNGASEKHLMRAFNNFYGDTVHSNGALAHNSQSHYFCARDDMEKAAGIFITEGFLDLRNNSLKYSDIIFMHNPFCLEEYRISSDDFNFEHIFESYVQFLNGKPVRGDRWANFIVRFFQNKYPDYNFLENDINYCRQKYPSIIAKPVDKNEWFL